MPISAALVIPSAVVAMMSLVLILDVTFTIAFTTSGTNIVLIITSSSALSMAMSTVTTSAACTL